MVISKLSKYNNITLNKSNERPGRITRITPHVFVNNVTGKQGVDYMTKLQSASVNYVVGTDGVGCQIPEDRRAWTSSSRANDEQAITIEIASDNRHPYKMRDEVINMFIDLVVDICKRYNRKKVVYIPQKEEALSYKVKDDEFLITFHKWFANTSCPGLFFLDNAQGIFDKVNEILQGKVITEEKPQYTVQLGAYYDVNRANAHSAQVRDSFIIQVKDLYKVFSGKGTKVEMIQHKNKSHPGGFVTELPDERVMPNKNEPLRLYDKVTLDPAATVYGSQRKFAKWVYNTELYVRGTGPDGKRIVVSTLKEGAVTGAVDAKYLRKV